MGEAELQDPGEVADPRVRTLVPMAPAGWYAFGETGEHLAEIPVSTLLLGGAADDLATPDGELEPTWAGLPSPKSYGLLQDAGHYIFSDMCALAPMLFEECDGSAAGWIDVDRGHAIVRTVVTAWLGRELRGQDAYGDWLGPQASPELTWQDG